MLLVYYQVREIRVELWNSLRLTDLECQVLFTLKFPDRNAIVRGVFAKLE